ncbi:hypothetical protein, partial [Mesorhizobium sp. B1-1-5]|uniref:hypothetical protein n=1 Tax=Mesorhizobium sp. B1-1-5 TaxID=2589979 RepID=UPI001AED660F
MIVADALAVAEYANVPSWLVRVPAFEMVRSPDEEEPFDMVTPPAKAFAPLMTVGLTALVLIVTLSAAVGTDAGVQFPAVNQFV